MAMVDEHTLRVGTDAAHMQALNEAFQTDPKTRPVWLGDIGI